MGFKSSKGVSVNSLIQVNRSKKSILGQSVNEPSPPVDIATPTITYPSSNGNTGKILEISSYSGGENYGATNIIITYNNGTNFDNANTFMYSVSDSSPSYVYIPTLPNNNNDIAAKVQYVNVKGESIIGPPIQFATTADIFAGNSSGTTEVSFPTQIDGPYGVANAFDGNTSTYFGPTSGGRNPSTAMIWNFTNGFPLSAGVTFQPQGFAGGGFQATITLANGQTANLGQTITVSSNTSISKFQCGLWGIGNQYSKISGFKINGVLATYKDI